VTSIALNPVSNYHQLSVPIIFLHIWESMRHTKLGGTSGKSAISLHLRPASNLVSAQESRLAQFLDRKLFHSFISSEYESQRKLRSYLFWMFLAGSKFRTQQKYKLTCSKNELGLVWTSTRVQGRKAQSFGNSAIELDRTILCANGECQSCRNSSVKKSRSHFRV
jgi:hypothetical protein